MRSKLILAAALVASLALPVTAAGARGFGGFHGGFGGGHVAFGGFHVAFGGFHGGFGGFHGGFGGFRGGGFRIGGFYRPFFFHRPFFFRRPFYAGLYGSPCWRLAWTPWGFHRRWVCGYPYSYY